MTAQEPPRLIAWCAWHLDFAEDAVLIQPAEPKSPTGADLYACPACREMHRLTPYAERQ
ncbi:hypothetical protein ACWIG4_18340 [Streptomyces sp. NPDC002248]